MLTETMAQKLALEHIRVATSASGAIKTEINRSTWETPEVSAAFMRSTPYQRIGETQNVAKLTHWLASDDSSHMVGATISVDGGLQLYPGFRAGG